VSDHETSVLGSRLTDLADELAPSIDVMSSVDGARVRYRRNRRLRLAVAGVVVTMAAVGVGVPLAVGSLSSAPGEVARPAPATATLPSDGERAARSAEEARDAAVAADRAADDRLAEERAAEQARRAQPISDALAGRTPPLELRVGADRGCRDVATSLTETLGSDVVSEGSGDLTTGCRWSAGGLALELSLAAGQTEEEMVREVDHSVSADDCYVQAMPSTVDVTPLTLCPAAAGTTWTLRVPDSAATGYWILSAEEVSGAAPDAGADGLLALVDAAAAHW
jgi:hypothetical protein